jgi:SAM-dependent methyltransferase
MPLSLYDFPDVYDVVLRRSPEVVPCEVRSIDALLGGRGAEGARILELACGACAHGIPLARMGYRVTGVDRSAAMQAEAARQAEAAGITLELAQGDITDFALDSGPFDAALFLYETFPVLTTYDEITRHFQAVRRHLITGGLYIIDLDARQHGVGTSAGEWGRKSLAIPGGSVEVWHEDFPGDWVQGTSRMALHTRICRGSATIETVDDWRLRVYSPWELSVLARTLEGWTLRGFVSWRDLSPDIAAEKHYFLVLEAS